LPIHPTAIIDRHAEIDPTVDVGPYCIIEANVRIAAGCRLYQNVYLTGWTTIAEKCELHPGVIVGHAPQDIKYKGDRSFCRIGQGTMLREYVTVHRGTIPESETVVGEECFFLAGSHVGHNCTVGNRVTLINDALLGGHVSVGNGTTIGGSVGIHQFVRIGELCMIAGTARVTMDVIPFALADASGRISGLNRIGLRRTGMPREHVQEIRLLYRLLFQRREPFFEVVQRIEQAASTPPGRRFVEFLKADSRRGLAGRPRKRANSNDTNADAV